tara:strand:+ start:305 stop:1267 length:963 start_codon:yes stop_codon:yes gene_type:complete
MANPRNKRKHIDLTCLKNDPLKEFKKLGYPPGQFCSFLEEYYPKLERAGCETVYGGNNNSEIVFGRDRNASLASGNGGSGGTQCGMIDLVAGRLSSRIRVGGKEKCEVLTGPNFFADAARVYITQRGDVDTYFGIGNVEDTDIGSTRDASAVGIKADHTRIIGRQTVRIYAGKAQAGGQGRDGELNSRGGKIDTQGVIELVSGDRPVQNAVLGVNLIKALRKIYEFLHQAFSAIHSQISIQKSMISTLATHVHAFPGTPSPALVAVGFKALMQEFILGFDQIMSQFNLAFDKMNKTGIGEPGSRHLPGADDVLSTKVFLT